MFRHMSPPISEPLWRVLNNQYEWNSLSPDDVLPLTKTTLSLSEEVLEYLVYQFRPSVPGQHVSKWLKFLVKRHMCWGEGARIRLFEQKHTKRVQKRRRQEEEGADLRESQPGSSVTLKKPNKK
jgi:hypothetical protein